MSLSPAALVTFLTVFTCWGLQFLGPAAGAGGCHDGQSADYPLEPSEPSWWHLLRPNMQILGEVECGLDQEKWGGIISIIGQYRWI